MAEVALNVSDCCDGCGGSMTKAKKIHKQLRYCATCYPRLFKRLMCSSCGNFARLPVFDQHAPCSPCLVAKPCVRCKRVGRPVGKITAYGPACNSCAHYFSAAQNCEVCSAPSTRLSRVLIGDEPRRCCEKCVRSTQGSCQSCGRHRVLTLTDDNRKLCGLCLSNNQVPCGTCKMSMPAGLGKECQACYWRRTYRKRLAINIEAFDCAQMRLLFQQFGQWLESRMDSKKAARSINSYLTFFLAISSSWSRVPTYEELLTRFGADELRKMQIPMVWLTESKGVTVDANARERHSEMRRIAEMLALLPEGRKRLILRAYHDDLMSRSSRGSTSLRSVRLALRPATNLLLLAGERQSDLPSNSTVAALLKNSPGSLASLTGFLNFLNEYYDLGIDVRASKAQIGRFAKAKLEHEILDLVREALAGKEVQERWVTKGMHYFHSVSRAKLSKDLQVSSAHGGGLLISMNGQEYWLPEPHEFTA